MILRWCEAHDLSVNQLGPAAGRLIRIPGNLEYMGPSRRQNARDFRERDTRIGHVLEHVLGDDKIKRFIKRRYTRQPSGLAPEIYATDGC